MGDSRGIQKIIQALLEIALQVGLLYNSTAHIRSGCELGVWTSHGKFAAVGIHVKDGIVLHGLSVNGYRTPESFQGLRPCGLDAPVAFLLGERAVGSGSALETSQEEEFVRLGHQILEFSRAAFTS